MYIVCMHPALCANETHVRFGGKPVVMIVVQR